MTVTQRGSDIVVALDISNSMLAEDVPPNRMERAKTELNSFPGTPGGQPYRSGIFRRRGFCAMSPDPGLRDRGDFPQDGRARHDVRAGHGHCGVALENRPRAPCQGPGRRPRREPFKPYSWSPTVRILKGTGKKEAEACHKDGIQLIPVGVGEESGGLIPTFDNRGRAAGFMKDEEGKVVMTRLDMASLAKLAAVGGGSPFHIGVDGLAGDRLFAELKRLGRRDLEERRISAYQERYHHSSADCPGLSFALRLLVAIQRGSAFGRKDRKPSWSAVPWWLVGLLVCGLIASGQADRMDWSARRSGNGDLGPGWGKVSGG